MKNAILLVSGVVTLGVCELFGGTVGGLGIDAAANRAVIQREVDAVSAVGGGRVEIPVGEWPCGSLELKSGVELHLPKGAVLKGSARQTDYSANDIFPENFWAPDEEWSGGHLVYAYKAHDVAITGEGVIDGNGPAFFPIKPDEEHCFPWYKYGLKLHTVDRTWFRPGPMVAMFLTKNIRLEGVTLRNTPCWTAHFRCCEGLVATNVTIDADRTIANSDGFSIDCTRKVRVSDCRVLTGDDGFAIRASCKHHAKDNVCGDILIENCDISSCCYGIRFGVGTGTIRGVEVRNCRVLEAANGFGFTTAWRDTGGRNCYIEDVTIQDTQVGNCAQAFEAVNFMGDCRVANIRCENCRFEALLPCIIRGNEKAWPRDISFSNCTLRLLKRIAGRDPGTLPGWMPKRENPPRKFLSLSGKSERVTETNCRVVDWGETGVLLLSFDDRNFKGWVEAMPLFEKYGARATFFVSGPIDKTAVSAMRKLADAGHTVGLHGLNHTDAVPAIRKVGAEKYFEDDIVPQIEACKAAGFNIHSFAYPNCVRDEVSDRLFYDHGFEHVRGSAGLTPFDPKGEKQAGRKPIATMEGSPFVPAAKVAETRLIEPILIGEAYHPDWNDIDACLRRAAERKEVFSIISHNIGESVWIIDMKTEWLERILKLARELDLPVVGFDELPLPKARLVSGNDALQRTDCRSVADFVRHAEAGERLNVVWFGGSLTWGANASDPNRTSLRALVSKRLEETYPKAHFRFKDAAIGGAGSTMEIFRVARDVLSEQPDLVFFDCLVNDGEEGEGDLADAAEESIIRRLIAESKAAVVPIMIPWSKTIETADEASLRRWHRQKELCRRYSLVSADILGECRRRFVARKLDMKAIWPDDFPDRLHPYDPGYRLYADILWEQVFACPSSLVPPSVLPPWLGKSTYAFVKRQPIATAATLPTGWRKTLPWLRAGSFDFSCSRWMDSICAAANCTRTGWETFEASGVSPAPLKGRFRGEVFTLIGESMPHCGAFRLVVDGEEVFKSYATNKMGKNFPPSAYLFTWPKDGFDPSVWHDFEIVPLFGAKDAPTELRLESVCVAGSEAAEVVFLH